jgi:hypothetical protein
VSAAAPRTGPRIVTDEDLGLTRLLAMARLTPVQAVALGADLLASLEERHAAGRTSLRPEAVRVGRDGRVRLIDDGAPRDPAADGVGLGTAAGLLDRIRASVRSSPAERELISALEQAAAAARRPDARIATVAATLRAAAAAGGAQARAELARLVAAGTGGVAPAWAIRPAPSGPSPRWHPPRRRPRQIVRSVFARAWTWVLALVVLAAAVLVEIAVLRDEIVRDVQAVLDAGRTESTATSTATSVALPPVVPPAPSSAGPIGRIGLRSVAPCAPGADCALHVQVMLAPQPEPQTVAWEFRIVDRCAAAVVTVPGGTVTVPPNSDRADVVSTVRLPEAEALAVLAVASQPAVAASAAANVPAAGACGI